MQTLDEGRAQLNISAENLTSFATAILVHAGASEDAARRVATRLVGANLTGHDSHGVGMIPAYVEGIIAGQLDPAAKALLIRENGPFLLVDGQQGFGHVIAEQAMDMAIQRAKDSQIALLSLRNSFHLGRLADWGAMAAEAGFICIIFANVQTSQPLVAPFGGSDGRFVTNPYCTAIPATAKTPMFLLDMATSTIAKGKARVAYLSGKVVPDGALIDAQGQPTNDPSVMFENPLGALTTFGLHKGFGLALLGDILGGSLSGGGAFAPERQVPSRIINNMMAILFNPDALGTGDDFACDMDRYTQWVKSSPAASGGAAVQFPGDPERRCAQDRQARGIPIDAGTWAQLLDTARVAGMLPDQIESFTMDLPFAAL
jgi:uncharacterized oxidoreductase